MTSRSKNAVRSYETEIEKSREESNWKKVVELAQQLKTRSPQHGGSRLPRRYLWAETTQNLSESYESCQN